MMSSTTVASRTSWPVHSCTCEEAPFAPVRSAASRTSWPRGVLSTCPMFITLVATPTAVGIAAMATTYAASAERPTAVARPAGRLGEGWGKGPSRGRRGRLRWRGAKGDRKGQRRAEEGGAQRSRPVRDEHVEVDLRSRGSEKVPRRCGEGSPHSTSASRPHETISRTRPTWPIIMTASGFGTKEERRGPSNIPQRSSPARLGSHSASASFPHAHSAM